MNLQQIPASPSKARHDDVEGILAYGPGYSLRLPIHCCNGQWRVQIFLSAEIGLKLIKTQLISLSNLLKTSL